MSQYRYIHSVWPASTGDGSTLSLDFTTGVLDPRLTFTRSTTGTYINSSGYVTSAAINAPRFDYDPTTLTPRGLLIEGSAATLNRYSEDFSNAYWTKVAISVSATSVAGPDNVSTATRRLVESSTTDQHCLRKGITTTAGTTYTVSVYVKPGSYDTFGLEFYWNASYNGKAEVTSISGNTATVTSASGVNASLSRTVMTASGWYRYALTFTHPSGVTGTITPDFNIAIKQTNPYVGNGTNYMDVYGFMLEAGSGASSYIPTGASTGSRASDDCQLLNLTTMGFNASEGTIYTDVGVRQNTGSQRNYTFLPASGSNNQIFEGSGTALNVYSSGSFVAQIGTSPLSASKIAAGYAVNDYAVSINGAAVVTDTSGALPSSLTKLTIGGSIVNASAYANGCIRTFKYWPTRLPNSQLQALTT